jgi:hypothetical protein
MVRVRGKRKDGSTECLVSPELMDSVVANKALIVRVAVALAVVGAA